MIVSRVRQLIGRRPEPPAPPPDAPPPAWFVREGMPVAGHTINAARKGEYGAVFTHEPGSAAKRRPLILSDPVDDAVAAYGFYFSKREHARFTPVPIQSVALGPGHVCGNDGIIVVDGKFIPETLRFIAHWRDDSCIARIEPKGSVVFKEGLTFAGSPHPGEYFVATGGAWPNYAHWMSEVLPRLIIFRQLRTSRRDMKVILPEFRPGSFQDQTLSLLGIEESAIHRMRARHVDSFEQVYAAFGIDLFAISPIVAHAAWILGSAYAARVPDPAPTPPAGRIYIHRRSDASRRVANFDEVMPVLEALKFRVVEFEDATLLEQIALMRSAKIVVAEHGAGAANFMFCQPGARAIELFNPACVQPAHWSLASRCGLSFGYMVGEHFAGPDGTKPLDWNSDYTIDPRRLKAALQSVIRKS